MRLDFLRLSSLGCWSGGFIWLHGMCLRYGYGVILGLGLILLFRLRILLFSRFGLGLNGIIQVKIVRLKWIRKGCVDLSREFYRYRVILWVIGTFWRLKRIFYGGFQGRCCSIVNILSNFWWNVNQMWLLIWINLRDRINIRFSLCFVLCILAIFLIRVLFNSFSLFMIFIFIRIF